MSSSRSQRQPLVGIGSPSASSAQFGNPIHVSVSATTLEVPTASQSPHTMFHSTTSQQHLGRRRQPLALISCSTPYASSFVLGDPFNISPAPPAEMLIIVQNPSAMDVSTLQQRQTLGIIDCSTPFIGNPNRPDLVSYTPPATPFQRTSPSRGFSLSSPTFQNLREVDFSTMQQRRPHGSIECPTPHTGNPNCPGLVSDTPPATPSDGIVSSDVGGKLSTFAPTSQSPDGKYLSAIQRPRPRSIIHYLTPYTGNFNLETTIGTPPATPLIPGAFSNPMESLPIFSSARIHTTDNSANGDFIGPFLDNYEQFDNPSEIPFSATASPSPNGPFLPLYHTRNNVGADYLIKSVSRYSSSIPATSSLSCFISFTPEAPSNTSFPSFGSNADLSSSLITSINQTTRPSPNPANTELLQTLTSSLRSTSLNAYSNEREDDNEEDKENHQLQVVETHEERIDGSENVIEYGELRDCMGDVAHRSGSDSKEGFEAIRAQVRKRRRSVSSNSEKYLEVRLPDQANKGKRQRLIEDGESDNGGRILTAGDLSSGHRSEKDVFREGYNGDGATTLSHAYLSVSNRFDNDSESQTAPMNTANFDIFEDTNNEANIARHLLDSSPHSKSAARQKTVEVLMQRGNAPRSSPRSARELFRAQYGDCLLASFDNIMAMYEASELHTPIYARTRAAADFVIWEDSDNEWLPEANVWSLGNGRIETVMYDDEDKENNAEMIANINELPSNTEGGEFGGSAYL